MKKLLSAAILLSLCAATAYGQKIYRSEFVTFDTRADALARNRANTVNYLKYSPRPISAVDRIEVVGEQIVVPVAWGDYDVYLHVENTIKAYDVVINGAAIASNDDGITPADYKISPFLRQGVNEIALRLRRADNPELGDDAVGRLCEQFEGCCIFAQYKTHIFDYDVAIRYDDKGVNALLSLDVVAANSFNYPERIDIGYDIYAPDGKLIDYAVREMNVAGRSVDTLRVRVNLGVAKGFAWGEGRAPLYKLMLFVKRDGKPREYIPVRVGLGSTAFDNRHIVRNGKPIKVRAEVYNARTTRKEALAEIRALKKRGINTLLPSNPQPAWFYDLCDGLGMYVIERANNNTAQRSADRTENGTPSNKPELANEYVERVKSMYYRTRNHSCIIAYALGGDRAGNGYNMYKAYEWLKSVEHSRAVICTTADGEWNTDIDKIE
ncbi:MAG: glycoside hydrolase family 2 TIM barrel-domain containing protein [Alistipes sp.]